MNRNRLRIKWLIAAIFMGTIWLLGCAAREHMSPNFGESTAAALEAQRVYPESSTTQSDGLDSEEAAIVHDSYRRSMGQTGSSGTSNTAKVLLIEDSENK